MVVDQGTCIRCDQCQRICPVGIRIYEDANSVSCVRCMQCVDECPVEAFKHRQRPLYGTQFHPEAYDEDHPQGQIILRNFLRLAGIAAPPAAGGRE